MKIFKNLIIVFLVIVFLTFFKVQAIECEPGISTAGMSNEQLNELIQKCNTKKNELNNRRSTLSTEIQFMDTQIYLTTLRITDTENKIMETEKEIGVLGSRIDGLDDSLTNLSAFLIKKIVKDYKQRAVSFFGLLFDSQNANDLLAKIKYIRTARNNNQKLLVQVQEAKSNFEEQKKIREDKKIELDELTNTLNAQKLSLASQKSQKQKLLLDTQNDEANYQRIISLAQAQLSGFKSFASSAGAGVISANQFGNGSDGSYYSQRDSRWASQNIGYSSENILDVGCLLSSVAIVGKRYGSNVTPADIAGDASRFFGNTAYMSLPWKSVAGRNYQGSVDIDQELSNGNYVIVGVGGCASGGSHFVVLTKKDGDDYIMHDPIYGPDLKFSSHYSNICSTATFK
jgi:peptidoglycan hydrolase CwlO-like protein